MQRQKATREILEGNRDSSQGTGLSSCLGPLLAVSQVTGMTFFGHVSGRKMKLIACYRIVILFLLLSCFVHELPTIRYWVSEVTGLHAMLAYLETWYRWTILFVNFVLTVANNGRIADSVSALSDVELTADGTVRRSIKRFQAVVISYNFAFTVCYMIAGYDFIWTNSNYYWYTSMIYILTEFYIAFSVIQFVGILFAVRKYFRLVNENLRKYLVPAGGPRDRRTFLFVIESVRLHNSLEDILKMRHLHLRLSLISEKLNECYTAQILLFIILCMIEITYSLRSSLIFIVTSNSKGSREFDPWGETTLTVLWGGYYLSSLMQLVSSCDMTANESKRTSVAVHELINTTQDKRTQRQLFSLQVMNHGAKFTAGRFFQLDYPLLHSIIGAITTYLVIIITFRE